MEKEEVVVEIVMGLILLFLSYQVGIKENITFLHIFSLFGIILFS